MFSVRIEQLAKKFGSKPVFEELSAHINQPIYGIQGSNGSGKSTLIRCLVYLIAPSNGQIIWQNGQNSRLSKIELKSSLGIAAPYISLYPQLSVAENIAFIRNLRAKSPLLESDPLLGQLKLEAIWKQSYKSLSTGQQQRVKIAVAVSHQPEVLILDEPGSNLDEAGHEMMHDLVMQRKASGKLTIIASNDSKEWAWCDQMLELR